MIAILEGPQRLIVDLRRGDDPEHQPPPPMQEPPVDQIDHPRGEQHLPAPGRDLQAEGGERIAHPGAPGAVGTAKAGVAPRPLDPDDPSNPLGRDRVRVVLALNEDEPTVASVLFVLREDCVCGGSGARKGFQDDGVFVGCDPQDAANKTSWLDCIENVFRTLEVENRDQFLLRFLRIANVRMETQGLRNNSLPHIRQKTL